MSTQQDLQHEVARLTALLADRDQEVASLRTRLTLEESGGDGLVPISALPDDYYEHDEARHCLVGQRWGRVYSLGEVITLRLVEANPVTGGLILNIVDAADREPGAASIKKDKRHKTSTGKKSPTYGQSIRRRARNRR